DPARGPCGGPRTRPRRGRRARGRGGARSLCRPHARPRARAHQGRVAGAARARSLRPAPPERLPRRKRGRAERAVSAPGEANVRRPRAGDSLEVTVEKGVYRGQGLARHEGQVVLVPRALPGDRLRVRVSSTSRGFLQATGEQLLAPGPSRRPSPCPYVPLCGGCAYQELDYPAQLRLKEAILRESLQRAGAAWDGEIPLAGSPEEGWRTRASLHFETRRGALLLGFREEGSRRVVDIERCLQLSPALNRAALSVRDALRG